MSKDKDLKIAEEHLKREYIEKQLRLEPYPALELVIYPMLRRIEALEARK